MTYSVFEFTLPAGDPYTNWGEWAALIMGAVDEVLANESNWAESDQPNVAANIEEIRYILPLLGLCVAALNEETMQFFVVAHQKAQNTHGGSTTSGADNVVPLNAEVHDPDNLVSFSGDNALLVPGTWLLIGLSQVFGGNETHALLYDVTNSAVLARGMSGYINSPYSVSGMVGVVAPLVNAADRSISLRVYTLTGQADQGLGLRNNKATETFAYLIGLKMA